VHAIPYRTCGPTDRDGVSSGTRVRWIAREETGDLERQVLALAVLRR